LKIAPANLHLCQMPWPRQLLKIFLWKQFEPISGPRGLANLPKDPKTAWNLKDAAWRNMVVKWCAMPPDKERRAGFMPWAIRNVFDSTSCHEPCLGLENHGWSLQATVTKRAPKGLSADQYPELCADQYLPKATTVRLQTTICWYRMAWACQTSREKQSKHLYGQYGDRVPLAIT